MKLNFYIILTSYVQNKFGYDQTHWLRSKHHFTGLMNGLMRMHDTDSDTQILSITKFINKLLYKIFLQNMTKRRSAQLPKKVCLVLTEF